MTGVCRVVEEDGVGCCGGRRAAIPAPQGCGEGRARGYHIREGPTCPPALRAVVRALLGGNTLGNGHRALRSSGLL